MPEYSSTTITPADGVKTPAMNGSTSGNFTLSALRDFILASKGQANGLASLDANGKLLSSQIPDFADDVIVVDSYATLPATGTAGKIYITADNNKMYRWDPDLETPNYVDLSIDLTEYARIEDIQDGNIQAGVAVKAFQDAMGRAIITTYETKADASDLKDAIEGNSQRIENLEVAVSGSLVQTNTDATQANTKTITNANSILPWAILKRVGARAVAWNQLSSVVEYNGTVNASSEYNIAQISYISGHRYTVVCTGVVSGTFVQTDKVQGIARVTAGNTSASGVASSSFTSSLYIRNNADSAITVSIKVNVFDMTANGYDTDLAGLLADFPAFPYPYHAPSIIPLNPSAFKVVGRNKVKVTSYSNVEITDVLPAGTYTISFKVTSSSSGGVNIIERSPDNTDLQILVNKSATGAVSGQSYTGTFTLTLPAKIFCNPYSGWNGAMNEVQIEIGSSATAYEPYSSTTIDTSFTSDYKYVNENCHDYSENVLVNGVMKREEHIVAGEDVISNANVAIDTARTNTTRAVFILTPSKPVAYSGSPDGVPNVEMGGFQAVSQNTVWASGMISSRIEDHLIYITTAPNMTIETFLATYEGQKVLYEVVESTYLHDPIPNIPCEDGTTITAITPQTDLVNAIDVPSTIAYMTKISS